MDLIYHNGNADITLNQIYTFIIVADYGNFTKASAELHVSQPSISKSISKLEEATGLNLLIRNPRGAILTAAGKILYKEWKESLKSMQTAFEQAQGSVMINKVLRIGIPASFAGNMKFMSVIDEFVLSHSEINVTLTETEFTDLHRGISAGKYDVIFAPSYEEDAYKLEGFQTQAVFPEPLELLFCDTPDSDCCRDMQISNLLTLPPERNYGYDDYTLKFLSHASYSYTQKSTLENLQAVKFGLLKGNGVFLSCRSWFPNLNRDLFLSLPFPEHTGHITMVWNQDSANQNIRVFRKYF